MIAIHWTMVDCGKGKHMVTVLQGMGRKNWGYSVIRYLHYLRRDILSFENGFRLIVKVDCKL